MKIPLEIERVKNSPYKLVKSGNKVVGVFNQGKFSDQRREIDKALKEAGNGKHTGDH